MSKHLFEVTFYMKDGGQEVTHVQATSREMAVIMAIDKLCIMFVSDINDCCLRTYAEQS